MPYIIKIDAERSEGGALVPKWLHLLIPNSRVSEHFLVSEDGWLTCLYGSQTQAPLFRMLSQLIAGIGLIAFDFNTRTIIEREGLTCPVLQLSNAAYLSQPSNAKSKESKTSGSCEKGERGC